MKRPLGIKLLALLTFFGGVFGFLFLFSHTESTWILVWASFLLIASLNFFSGIGLWLRKKWGWWIASFNFLYAATRGINVMYHLLTNNVSFEGESKQFIKYGGRTIISLLILGYLFRKKTLQYFSLEGRSKKFLILTLVLPLVLLVILASVYVHVFV